MKLITKIGKFLMTLSLMGAVVWMWIQRITLFVPHLQHRLVATVTNPLTDYGVQTAFTWLEKDQLPVIILMSVISVAMVINCFLSWNGMKRRWMFRIYVSCFVIGMLGLVGLAIFGLPIAPINQISTWHLSTRGMLLLIGVALIWMIQMVVVWYRRRHYVLSTKEIKISEDETLLSDEIMMENGEFSGVKLSIRDAAISIGTDPKYVNLVIDDPELSRIHCVIGYDVAYGQCYCVDHSRNGVYIEQNECIKRVRPQQTCWIPGGSTLILAHSLCRIKVGERNGERDKEKG